VDSNQSIKGFGGTKTSDVKIGTIAWKWCNDNGKLHKFIIPKSFYVPSSNVCLPIPQHWGETQKGNEKSKFGTGSETVSNKVTHFWNDRKNQLTIPLGKNDNVVTFTTNPGYSRFAAFCATADLNYATKQVDPIIATPAKAVSDDEESEDNEDNIESEDGSIDSPSTDPKREVWCKPIGTTFDLNLHGSQKKGRPAIIEDEEDQQPTSNAAKLLRYHHKFGHVLFKKLQEMAKIRAIPKQLATCTVPSCSACLYTKAIKRKWRS
jgi:hypothetical protein